MKKLFISFILICFLVSNAYAIVVGYSRTFGGAPLPDILWETFDTNPGYDNTWTPDATPMNPDVSTGAIQGSESLGKEASTNQLASSHAFAALSDGYYSVAIKYTTSPNRMEMFRINDNGGNLLGRITIWTNATEWYGYGAGGGNTPAQTKTFVNGTTYYLGIKLTNGAGSGVAEFFVSDTPLSTSWGTANVSLTSLTVVDATELLVGPELAWFNEGCLFDAVGIATTEIAWDGN